MIIPQSSDVFLASVTFSTIPSKGLGAEKKPHFLLFWQFQDDHKFLFYQKFQLKKHYK